MKKHFPDLEYAARYRTPVVVSLLTIVGAELGVVSSSHMIEPSIDSSSGIVASR
jgi:hypothetical protein